MSSRIAPAPAAPPPAASRWRTPLLAGVVVALLGAAIWLRLHDRDLGFPTLGQSDVAALDGGEEGERRLMAHFAERLYAGHDLADWHGLVEPARHCWAAITVEDRVVHGPMPGASGADGAPGLLDAAAAHAAWGSTAMAELLRARADGHGEGFRAAFDRLLPEARKARAAYVRTHAAAIVAAVP